MSHEQEYCVHWHMTVKASSPLEAARMVLAVHRDPDSIATVFDVYDGGHRDDTAEERVAQVDLTDGTVSP